MNEHKQSKFIIDVSAPAKRPNLSTTRFFSYDSHTAEIVIQAEKDGKLIDQTLVDTVEIYFESVNMKYRPIDGLKWNDTMEIGTDGLYSYILPDDFLNYEGLVAFDVYINYKNGDKADSSNRIIFEQRISAIDRAAGVVELVYIKDMEQAKQAVADKADEVMAGMAGYESSLADYEHQIKDGMDQLYDSVANVSADEITKIREELPKVETVATEEITKIQAVLPDVQATAADETAKIKAQLPIVEAVAMAETEKIQAELPKVQSVTVEEISKIKAELPKVQTVATEEIGKIRDVLSTVEQTAQEVSDHADQRIVEYDDKFAQSDKKMSQLQNSQTALDSKLTETQQKITDADVYTKEESSANVINQIGGTETAILKKEMLVDGTEGVGSRHANDLGTQNLMGALISPRYSYDADVSRIKTSGVTEGQTISKVTLGAGTYTVSLILFAKPTKATSFSCYFNGAVQNNQSFVGIDNFNSEQLYTRLITLAEDTEIIYKSWGNPDVDQIEFQMKIEKGNYTKFTPSEEWVENGMVSFSDSDYENMLSEDGIVEAETNIVGRGAGIQFDFPVLANLETKYPYLFENVTTTAEKIAKFKSIVKSEKLTGIYRGGGLNSSGSAVNGAEAKIYAGGGVWWGTNTRTNSADFAEKSAVFNASQINTLTSSGGYRLQVVNAGAISDGVTLAWVEVKDIRLIVELEVNGHTIIEEMIAAYHIENVQPSLTDLAARVLALESKSN